jgi:hypothetical protein
LKHDPRIDIGTVYCSGEQPFNRQKPVLSVKKGHFKVLSRLMSQSKAEERATGGDVTHGLSWLKGSALQYPQSSGDRAVIAKLRGCHHRSALATI